MKSWWFLTRGDQIVIEPREAPEPTPKAGEVLIEVGAAAFNRGGLITGSVVHVATDRIGGMEASGVVRALGDGVSSLKVGDRVMGTVTGAMAQYATMEARRAMIVPRNWSLEQAVPLSYVTAFEALIDSGGARKGDWVLVTGASSGTGVACIQLARLIGAHTIGTTGSGQKLAKLRDIGMDVGIQTRSPDFSDKVREATDGKGVALAINLVGGTLFAECLRSLGRQGGLAVVGYVDGVYTAPIDLNAVHGQRLRVFGLSNARRLAEEQIGVLERFKRDILPLIESSGMTPVVDRVFGFDDVLAARAYFDSHAMVGKVVVSMGL